MYMTGIWLISYVALWVLFLGVAVVLISVLRNLGIIYESIQQLPQLRTSPTKLETGQALPNIMLQTLSGEALSLAALQGSKTAVSIVSTQCGPCRDLLSTIALGTDQADPLDPTVRRRVVVSLSDMLTTAQLIDQVGLSTNVPVFVDPETNVTKEWGITTTPTTVIVDEQLKVVRQVFGAY
jgi:hypothetical protein